MSMDIWFERLIILSKFESDVTNIKSKHNTNVKRAIPFIFLFIAGRRECSVKMRVVR